MARPAVPSIASIAATDTVAYTRVSTEDQATDRRTSLADQRTAIDVLACQLSRVVGHVFEDPGASGASAEGRPGFMQLVTFCQAHRRLPRAPGYVLVLNDSRWGRFRDPEEATYWRVELKRHGWIVRFAEGDETQDPLARGVLRTIHSAQATAYREAIRANAKRGARGTAAQGFWQNEAPFGYRRQAEAAGRPYRVLEPGQRKADDEKVRLVPGPADEQTAVRWMFETYATGTVSLGTLMRELRVRFPRLKWPRQNVARVLRNRAYLGEVIWCRRPHDALERAEQRVRPRAEWVIVPDAHPALVTPALFAAVDAQLGRHRRALRRTTGGYALSGLLHCKHCGRPFIGAGGPKGPAEDPDRYRFYRCTGQKEHAWTCTGPSGILSRRLIEPAVLAAIGQVVTDPAVLEAVTAELDRVLAADPDAEASSRADLGRRREQVAAAQERLVGAIAGGTLTAAEAEPQLARIRQERDEIDAALDRVRFAPRRQEAMQAERARLLAIAQDFPALARRLHGLELRELLRPWLADATVDLATRKVRLTIRRIPEATMMVLSPQPGRG